MPIQVACPQCGKTLRVGDHVAGKRIRCPVCQATTVVPELTEADHHDPDRQSVPKNRSGKENRAAPKRRTPEPFATNELPDDCFDSYGEDAVTLPSRVRSSEKRENTVRESTASGMLRRHWIESIVASAIAGVWCGFFGLGALLLLDETDGLDMDKVRSISGAMLVFSGTLFVALAMQIAKKVPLLYVSMVLVGVTGAILTLTAIAGEWLMLVASLACFVALHRLRSVIRLLQES